MFIAQPVPKVPCPSGAKWEIDTRAIERAPSNKREDMAPRWGFELLCTRQLLLTSCPSGTVTDVAPLNSRPFCEMQSLAVVHGRIRALPPGARPGGRFRVRWIILDKIIFCLSLGPMSLNMCFLINPIIPNKLIGQRNNEGSITGSRFKQRARGRTIYPCSGASVKRICRKKRSYC